jgi:hypothetical protein
MTEQSHISEPKAVACGVCLKEVPPSEAKSEEALDYVVHFCGLDCYQTWKNGQDTATPDKPA